MVKIFGVGERISTYPGELNTIHKSMLRSAIVDQLSVLHFIVSEYLRYPNLRDWYACQVLTSECSSMKIQYNAHGISS